jgi:hypothetical protein
MPWDQGERFRRRDRWRLAAILAVAFAIRLVFALRSNNLHYADELFQYLEQGHRWVFGYGIIPWEFRYGFRSWLLPGVIAAILHLARMLGLDDPDSYVKLVRGIFALFSLVPVAGGVFLAYRLHGRRAAYLAAMFLSFWYEMVYFASRTLTEPVAADFLIAALVCFFLRQNLWAAGGFGFAVGAVSAFRIQFAPASLTLLALYGAEQGMRHRLGVACATFLLTLLAAGVVDVLTWGEMFGSYVTTIKTYFLSGVDFEHKTSWDAYVNRLFLASAGLFLILFAGTVVRAAQRPEFPLYVLIVVIVGSHSLLGLKQYRFVFPVVPLLLILFSIQLALLWDKAPTVAKLVAAYTGLLSILGMWGVLPYERWEDRRVPLFASNPHLDLYLHLARRGSVRSVCDLTHWIQSGGYFFLHRDVPLLFPGEKVNDPACLTASHAVTFGARFTAELRAADFAPVKSFDRLLLWQRRGEVKDASMPECYGRFAPQPGIDLVLRGYPKKIFGVARREVERFEACLAAGRFTGFAFPEAGN